MFPTKVELQQLIKYYDVDGDGNIGYEEFLSGLRDPLNARKQAIVDRAFSLLDKNGCGEINAADVASLYDTSRHPAVIEGKKTHDQVLSEFLNSFEGLHGNRDGIISKAEWDKYYTNLGMSVPSDEYFVRMMEQVWAISEDEQSGVFEDEVRRVIGLIRQRLLTISGESTEEFTLRKLFKDFDTNDSGSITLDELAAMIAKLEISVERKYINGIMKKFDTNNTSMIEFEEFTSVLINDPYK